MSTGNDGIHGLLWVLLAASSLLLWTLPLHGAMWILRNRSQSKFVWLKAAAVALLGWATIFALVVGFAILGYCENCADPRRDLIEILVFFVACSAAHYALYRTWRARPSSSEGK